MSVTLLSEFWAPTMNIFIWLQEKFNEVEEENEKLKKKMEKLKRRHKLEVVAIKQNLKQNTLPESALQPLQQRNSLATEEGM